MKKFKTAAILAGGKSTRMGQDKKNLIISGEVLLQSIVDQLGVLFEEVLVVGCCEADIKGIRGITGVYSDALDIAASLTGIYTALLHAQSEMVYVTACDMPNYSVAYIRYMMSLLEEKQDKDGCVTRYGEWIEPFNAFYSQNLMSAMESFLKGGRKSVFNFLSTEKIHYIAEKDARFFSPDWKIFCNLNTPGDLKKYAGGTSHVNDTRRNCQDHPKGY